MVKLLAVLSLLLAGCELAFPITLDAAEIEDGDASDASGEVGSDHASDAPAELDRFDQDRREK